MSEWAVDYHVPGGTDKEGWQYAADFPAYVIIIFQDAVSKQIVTKRGVQVKLSDLSLSYRTFHGHKTMKDFVRRRRWTR